MTDNKYIILFQQKLGGGIYIYTGQLDDGNYFMAFDECDRYVLFLDIDPNEYWDDNGFIEWQEEHKTGEITGEEAKTFWKTMLPMCDMLDVDRDNRIDKLL